jgi:hypothetical protein
MATLEQQKNLIPSDHYKFLNLCKRKVELALSIVEPKQMLPPVIFILSEDNRTSHMMYDVNLLHSNQRAFKKKYQDIDSELLKKGFDASIYVCVSEASMRTADDRFREEIKNKNIDFNNITPDDYEMLANASKKLEVKDVVFMSAFNFNYQYIATFDRDTKKQIDEILTFDSSKGRVSDVFAGILERKMNYETRGF